MAATVSRRRTGTSAPSSGPSRQHSVAADLSYRLIFAATWVVLIAAVVLALTSRFDWPFLAEWWWFILRGAEATILLTVTSITLACVLAVLGALGRLSLNPVANGSPHCTCRSSAARRSWSRSSCGPTRLAELGLVLPLFWAGDHRPRRQLRRVHDRDLPRRHPGGAPRAARRRRWRSGMRERLIMRRIVLPQAIRIVIPAIGNDFIAMIKDTSLVFAIGIQELLFRANSAGRQTINIMEALLFAAAVYWGLTLLFSYVQQRLERTVGQERPLM